MEQVKTIIQKDGLVFKRIELEEYALHFSLQNEKTNLLNLIDFPFISLIFELNKDIFEFVRIERKNETEAIVTVLTRNIFEDIGINQKHIYARIQKKVDGQLTTFLLGSIRTHCPEMALEAEPLYVDDWVCECRFEDSTCVNFEIKLRNLYIPAFLEKVVGVFSLKVIERIKQYIENLS